MYFLNTFPKLKRIVFLIKSTLIINCISLLQEVDDLLDLFKKVKDQINSKIESVQRASSKVTDVRNSVDYLAKRLESRYQRVIVVEREIIEFEALINETRILREETKQMLDKFERRYKCYFECNPNTVNPCFND